MAASKLGEGGEISINRINPPELHETPGYHHVTVVRAPRLAMLAGQCPLDRTGDMVGPGDVAR